MLTKKAPFKQGDIETVEISSEAKVTSKARSASSEYKKVCQQIDRMRTIAKRIR